MDTLNVVYMITKGYKRETGLQVKQSDIKSDFVNYLGG
jgi:hypothetical protein